MSTENPRGKLIPIGGKEAKKPDDESRRSGSFFFGEGVLAEVLEQLRGKDSHIGLITTASGTPEEIAEAYLQAFEKLGCKNVEVLHLDKRNVDSKVHLELLSRLDGVFMTGGDQMRLKEKIYGSEFLRAMKKRYQETDFVIAGTSAGAMAMSELMISEGEDSESLLKNMVELEAGFTLLPGTIIDPHFMVRGRFARLTEAILKNRNLTAIGICEDTALIISDGNVLDAIGTGTVIIFEANHIRSTNFKKAKAGQAVYVEGLRLHILAKGAKYLLKERIFIGG